MPPNLVQLMSLLGPMNTLLLPDLTFFPGVTAFGLLSLELVKFPFTLSLLLFLSGLWICSFFLSPCSKAPLNTTSWERWNEMRVRVKSVMEKGLKKRMARKFPGWRIKSNFSETDIWNEFGIWSSRFSFCSVNTTYSLWKSICSLPDFYFFFFLHFCYIHLHLLIQFRVAQNS